MPRQWLPLLLCCATAIALPFPAPQEVDSEEARRVLGSSVVTSVSVIMDLGNGTKKYYADAEGRPVAKPTSGSLVGSPAGLLNPDRYEFYTFDESGDLVKRLMTLKEIQSIIAGGDVESDSGPSYYHQKLPEEPKKNKTEESFVSTLKGVHDVLASVKNVLKGELEAKQNTSESTPVNRPTDTATIWSAIIPGLHVSSETAYYDDVTSTTGAPSRDDTAPPTAAESSTSSILEKETPLHSVNSLQSLDDKPLETAASHEVIVSYATTTKAPITSTEKVTEATTKVSDATVVTSSAKPQEPSTTTVLASTTTPTAVVASSTTTTTAAPTSSEPSKEVVVAEVKISTKNVTKLEEVSNNSEAESDKVVAETQISSVSEIIKTESTAAPPVSSTIKLKNSPTTTAAPAKVTDTTTVVSKKSTTTTASPVATTAAVPISEEPATTKKEVTVTSPTTPATVEKVDISETVDKMSSQEVSTAAPSQVKEKVTEISKQTVATTQESSSTVKSDVKEETEKITESNDAKISEPSASILDSVLVSNVPSDVKVSSSGVTVVLDAENATVAQQTVSTTENVKTVSKESEVSNKDVAASHTDVVVIKDAAVNLTSTVVNPIEAASSSVAVTEKSENFATTSDSVKVSSASVNTKSATEATKKDATTPAASSSTTEKTEVKESSTTTSTINITSSAVETELTAASNATSVVAEADSSLSTKISQTLNENLNIAELAESVSNLLSQVADNATATTILSDNVSSTVVTFSTTPASATVASETVEVTTPKPEVAKKEDTKEEEGAASSISESSEEVPSSIAVTTLPAEKEAEITTTEAVSDTTVEYKVEASNDGFVTVSDTTDQPKLEVDSATTTESVKQTETTIALPTTTERDELETTTTVAEKNNTVEVIVKKTDEVTETGASNVAEVTVNVTNVAENVTVVTDKLEKLGEGVTVVAEVQTTESIETTTLPLKDALVGSGSQVEYANEEAHTTTGAPPTTDIETTATAVPETTTEVAEDNTEGSASTDRVPEEAWTEEDVGTTTEQAATPTATTETSILTTIITEKAVTSTKTENTTKYVGEDIEIAFSRKNATEIRVPPPVTTEGATKKTAEKTRGTPRPEQVSELPTQKVSKVKSSEKTKPTSPQKWTLVSTIAPKVNRTTSTDVTTTEKSGSDEIVDVVVKNGASFGAKLTNSDKITTTSSIQTTTIQPLKIAASNVLTTISPLKFASKVQSATLPPLKAPSSSSSPVDLFPAPKENLGLEATTLALDEDVLRFSDLCNELAFRMWDSVATKGHMSSRSLILSPFAVTSLLAMVFLGARGPTSGQMNDILRLDDMVTFNPHQVFRNVTESVVLAKNPGIATAAFVRELYSDRSKGKLLDFYKERAQQFYDGHVEEVNFKIIGDILRRRTNLLIKRQTFGKVPEYLRGSSLILRPPLAAFSANIFQTDCRLASTAGRDGEMYFTVRPASRQRRLVLVPAVVYRGGFVAGYNPGLDATVVAVGEGVVSTVLLLPGQQGTIAAGDGLGQLEARLLEAPYLRGAWSQLLRSLLPRPGLELQLPRFSHRSLLNLTAPLQRMGLRDLFSEGKADLRGLNGVSSDMHLSDIVQLNTFGTCSEESLDSRHHVEVFPVASQRAGREEQQLNAGLSTLPLALRPRQARLPDSPRLRFDRPFLYFVRHNPTGLILHMGRFNPRLVH